MKLSDCIRDRYTYNVREAFQQQQLHQRHYQLHIYIRQHLPSLCYQFLSFYLRVCERDLHFLCIVRNENMWNKEDENQFNAFHYFLYVMTLYVCYVTCNCCNLYIHECIIIELNV